MNAGGWQDPPPSGAGGGVQLAMPSLTPGVRALLIANVGTFAVLFVASVLLGTDSRVLRLGLAALSLDVDVWRRYFPFEPLWQLVTYGFLHSLHGLGHVFWNMLQLYFFGTLLEGTIGTRRFLVFWFTALVAGGALHLLVELASGGVGAALGASGGTVALVVACGMLFPRRTVFLLFFPIQMRVLAVLVVGMDLFQVLVGLRDGVNDHVAHWVHLGGAAFAFLAVWRRWIWFDPFQRLEAKRAVAEASRQIEEERSVDEILAKISREGFPSLTRREREILQRASKRQRDGR